MTTIDPTTPIGKMRLRVGDWADVVWLPDSVYQTALDDNSGNIVRASAVVAQYILAMLTRGTKTRLAQIESYDNQAFEQYKEFLILTTKDPAFMPYCPVVFGGGLTEENPLTHFQKYWNAGYINYGTGIGLGTSYDDMAWWYKGGGAVNNTWNIIV